MRRDIVRWDEQVPENYINTSRDFQVLTRLLTYGLNSSKFDADTIKYFNVATLVNSRLLPLLQRKVGFFSKVNFQDDYIRALCEVFYAIVKKKGSLSGVEEAIRLFFSVQHINTTAYITNYGSNDPSYPCELWIGINSKIKDVSLLQEILKYVIPTGYILKIYFYESTTALIDLWENTTTIVINNEPILNDSRKDYTHTSYIYTSGLDSIIPDNTIDTNTVKYFVSYSFDHEYIQAIDFKEKEFFENHSELTSGDVVELIYQSNAWTVDNVPVDPVYYGINTITWVQEPTENAAIKIIVNDNSAFLDQAINTSTILSLEQLN